MTKNEAYFELESIKRMKQTQEALFLKIRELEDNIGNIQSMLGRERVQGGRNDSLERMIDILIESEKRWNRVIHEKDDRIAVILEKIELLRSPFNDVLLRRYYLLQDNKRIATELNYSADYVNNLVCMGVIEYAKIKEGN